MKQIISATIAVLVAFSFGVATNNLWNFFRYRDTRRPPTGVERKVGSAWVYQNQVVEAEPSFEKDQDPIKARGESVFIAFYPTGEFASIGCALTADGSEHMRIVVEDEFVVYRGSWKRNSDGTITTTQQMTHGPGMSDYSLKGERQVIFKPIGNVVSERGLLETARNSFVQIFDSEIKNLDELPRMIAAGNR